MKPIYNSQFYSYKSCIPITELSLHKFIIIPSNGLSLLSLTNQNASVNSGNYKDSC